MSTILLVLIASNVFANIVLAHFMTKNFAPKPRSLFMLLAPFAGPVVILIALIVRSVKKSNRAHWMPVAKA